MDKASTFERSGCVIFLLVYLDGVGCRAHCFDLTCVGPLGSRYSALRAVVPIVCGPSGDSRLPVVMTDVGIALFVFLPTARCDHSLRHSGTYQQMMPPGVRSLSSLYVAAPCLQLQRDGESNGLHLAASPRLHVSRTLLGSLPSRFSWSYFQEATLSPFPPPPPRPFATPPHGHPPCLVKGLGTPLQENRVMDILHTLWLSGVRQG